MARGAPLVSVIIPTYNWPGALRYAIRSVLRQTLADFELLVVGDGCTDDTAEVVAGFADERLHWHNLPVNSGSQSAPNNYGIETARGRYLAFLGHDDLWHPEHLAHLTALIESTGAGLVAALAELIYPDGERMVSGLTLDGRLGADDNLAPSSLLLRRELALRVGPWKPHGETPWPVDVEWLGRIRAAGTAISLSERLTVVKLPASGRWNSYAIGASDEQAAYARRLESEPDFEYREMLAIARSHLERPARRCLVPEIPANAPPGWIAQGLRQWRGLEPDRAPMPALDARWRSADFPLRIVEVPRRAVAGEELVARATVANGSDVALRSHPPHPVHLSYRWATSGGAVAVADGRRTLLLPELTPGAQATYEIAVQAPPAPGRFVLRLSLVQENVRWLDEPARPESWATLAITPAARRDRR